VGTNHTCLANAKQRLGKQPLLGKNLVAVNRVLANHRLGKQPLLGKAYNNTGNIVLLLYRLQIKWEIKKNGQRRVFYAV
jgi:hypothetical protein